jgi:hypothetical protein
MKCSMYVDKYFWFLDLMSYYEAFSCNRRNSYIVCAYDEKYNFNFESNAQVEQCLTHLIFIFQCLQYFPNSRNCILSFTAAYMLVVMSIMAVMGNIKPYTEKPRFNVPAFSEIPDLVMIFSCPDNSSK